GDLGRADLAGGCALSGVDSPGHASFSHGSGLPIAGIISKNPAGAGLSPSFGSPMIATEGEKGIKGVEGEEKGTKKGEERIEAGLRLNAVISVPFISAVFAPVPAGIEVGTDRAILTRFR